MKYFTLAELSVTKSKLRNTPDAQSELNIIDLVYNVLDPLRILYGKIIRVNSGYRSPAVNLAIGGAATSQHCKGMAVDLDSDDNALLFKLIREHLLFDQLIWEGGDDNQPAWIHVSFNKTRNRKEVLRMKNGKYIKM